jgi:hypothetical protein
MGCSETSDTNYDTGIEISEDISLQPDESYGTKKFTNCFNSSSSVSNGQWTGLASGNYYFQVDYIDDGVNYDNQLNVNTVYQDTTEADQ